MSRRENVSRRTTRGPSRVRARVQNPSSFGGISLKRAPFDLGKIGVECVYLGEVLEIELSDRVFRFGTHVHLLHFPDSETLAIFEGGKLKTQKTIDDDDALVSAVKFEEWSGRGVEWAANVNLPVGRYWKNLGDLARIDYQSNKWGKDAEYTHEVESFGDVKIYYCAKGKRSPGVFFVRGLSVTHRGIEG